MPQLKAESLIVTCIDFRLQEIINNWISKNFKQGSFDRVAFGGSVKNLDIILTQVDKAIQLHHIDKVFLINHEECGAYGNESTPEKHSEDLKNSKSRIKQLYPNLDVETYYLHLNGDFEKIN